MQAIAIRSQIRCVFTIANGFFNFTQRRIKIKKYSFVSDSEVQKEIKDSSFSSYIKINNDNKSIRCQCNESTCRKKIVHLHWNHNNDKMIFKSCEAAYLYIVCMRVANNKNFKQI